MPGIKGMFASWNEGNRKDKLSDFVESFWHYDKITCLDEMEFINQYINWAKEKKYHQSQAKARQYISWLMKVFRPYLQKPHPSKCW